MFRRVLHYSGGVLGGVGLFSRPVTFKIETDDDTHPAFSEASYGHQFQEFSLFSHSHEGRADQLRKYETVDGFEMDASLEIPVTRASLAEGLLEVKSRPIQVEEVEAAVAFLRSGAPSAAAEMVDASCLRLMEACLSDESISGAVMTGIAQDVLKNDPSLGYTVAQSLLRLIRCSSETTAEGDDSCRRLAECTGGTVAYCDATNNEGADAWHDLRQRYKCSVCLDVLAAPHLLISCLHSFCGECIKDHISANEADCDLVCCPKCRHEINQEPCYEPDFDDIILSAVEQAPDCEDKSCWMKKRQNFVKQMTELKKKQTGDDLASNSWDDWAGAPFVHRLLGALVLLVMVVVFTRKFNAASKL